ncbi:MAG: magnesium transporter CorA family protein, partial [Vulcanimicrobiaceae bacterium]
MDDDERCCRHHGWLRATYVQAAVIAFRKGITHDVCERERSLDFVYVIVDEIAERFLTMVDGFDDNIDELEDYVNDWPATEIRERISSIRHDILHVRRVLAPTRDAARAVLDERVELDGDVSLFPRDIELHFADAYDKLLRATDGLDLSRDLLAGVRDFHQAEVANDQNEVMKRLTVVASVLLLPTFIVGLYGQNFKHIPETGWGQGYAWSWGLIVVT